jgi:hypothetical protein
MSAAKETTITGASSAAFSKGHERSQATSAVSPTHAAVAAAILEARMRGA